MSIFIHSTFVHCNGLLWLLFLSSDYTSWTSDYNATQSEATIPENEYVPLVDPEKDFVPPPLLKKMTLPLDPKNDPPSAENVAFPNHDQDFPSPSGPSQKSSFL